MQFSVRAQIGLIEGACCRVVIADTTMEHPYEGVSFDIGCFTGYVAPRYLFHTLAVVAGCRGLMG